MAPLPVLILLLDPRRTQFTRCDDDCIVFQVFLKRIGDALYNLVLARRISVPHFLKAAEVAFLVNEVSLIKEHQIPRLSPVSCTRPVNMKQPFFTSQRHYLTGQLQHQRCLSSQTVMLKSIGHKSISRLIAFVLHLKAVRPWFRVRIHLPFLHLKELCKCNSKFRMIWGKIYHL